MNKLSTAARAHILTLLVEGMAMRATARAAGCSFNTVVKLIRDAGRACSAYHDTHVRGIQGRRYIECDEIWTFLYAKEKNVPVAVAAPSGAGHIWTWTALDAGAKLIISYLVSNDRDATPAQIFMSDLASRLEEEPELYTDGLQSYVTGVQHAFGQYIDFAQLVKEFSRGRIAHAADDPGQKYSLGRITGITKKLVSGHPDMSRVSTSYVERNNLTMRMSMRRYTRLTNAFSKNVEMHVAMLHLYFLFYNHCRIHGTLKTTPAVAAGLTDNVYDVEWIVGLIDDATPPPKKPGPAVGTKYRPRRIRPHC